MRSGREDGRKGHKSGSIGGKKQKGAPADLLSQQDYPVHEQPGEKGL
jgi:hypothetical protein